MGFLTGNTIGDRRKHLQKIMIDRRLHVEEKQFSDETARLSMEIYGLQEQVRQLDQQLDAITLKLGNLQFESQWLLLEQEKTKVEQQLERLTNIEIREARELEKDLMKFSGLVRKEEKFDRSYA